MDNTQQRLEAFKEFLKALREGRRFTQLELALAANLDVNVIARIEQAKTKNLLPYLPDLANALKLNDVERHEFFAVAGYTYPLQAQSQDVNYLKSLLTMINLPASIRSPLWDFEAINEYHRILWGYTEEHVQLLKEGTLGSNLLRVYFDPQFSSIRYGSEDKLWLPRVVYRFRAISFPYITTRRYKTIVNYLRQNYPSFVDAWYASEDRFIRDEIKSFEAVYRVNHGNLGKLSYLSLRISSEYTGSPLYVSVYVPVNEPVNLERYSKLIGNTRNFVHSFRHEPLI